MFSIPVVGEGSEPHVQVHADDRSLAELAAVHTADASLLEATSVGESAALAAGLVP